MDSLCIRLTLSFKGSTPTEFYWSESLVNESISPMNNENNFDPVDHPQYSSYVNLHKSTEKFREKNRESGECMYLNPERGVMHQLDNNVWVFYEGAIDWDNFSRITRIPLSPVRNDFSLISNRALNAMLWRYVGKGAGVTASYLAEDQTISCTIGKGSSYHETRDSIHELAAFHKANRRKPGFKIVIYPLSSGTEDTIR